MIKHLFVFLIAAMVLSVPAFAQESSVLMEKAGKALENQDYETAAALYSSVIEQEPRNGIATYNRAICYLSTKQIDKDV